MLDATPKTAIILAGGQSRRMGRDKGLMEIAGKPMIQYVIDTLTSLVDTILISTSNKAYEQFGYPCIADVFPNSGPLGAIYSGLYHSKSDAILVVSCDTPFIPKPLLRQLINGYDGFGCIHTIEFREQLMPTIGIYDKRCLEPFKERLETQQYRLIDAVEDEVIQVIRVPSDLGTALININTKEEYQKIR